MTIFKHSLRSRDARFSACFLDAISANERRLAFFGRFLMIDCSVISICPFFLFCLMHADYWCASCTGLRRCWLMNHQSNSESSTENVWNGGKLTECVDFRGFFFRLKIEYLAMDLFCLMHRLVTVVYNGCCLDISTSIGIFCCWILRNWHNNFKGLTSNSWKRIVKTYPPLYFFQFNLSLIIEDK